MIEAPVHERVKIRHFYHSHVVTILSKQKIDPIDKKVTISKGLWGNLRKI